MSYEQQNRQAIIDYFAGGCKGEAPMGALGLEIEHFVVTDPDLGPVTYLGEGAAFGVRDVLEYLSRFYPKRLFSTQGDLIGLAFPEGTITLEPAAQLEISIAPYTQIAQIERVYADFRAHLDPYLAERGATLLSRGYHPTAKALELPLIPKTRYRYMNAYFADLGTHGERMMRASASTQVSVDYRDEADAVRKLRVAQALTVVLGSLTDNIDAMEGAPTDVPMERLNLWRDVDNARCGSIPGLFEPGFGFSDYVDWVLGTCPIFVTRAAADDPQGPKTRSVAGLAAREAYADAPMDTADVEHLLSMFWPDVRLKRFVEIRPADSLPIDQALGYVALIKGIFYSENSLAAVERAFGVRDGVWPLDDRSTDEALAAVRRDGRAGAVIYGRPFVEWQDFLLDTARAALDEADRAYLAALERRIAGLRAE